METKKVRIVYHEDKDILSVIVLPIRPSRTGGSDRDFLTLYHWDNPNEIVGFEILDFSLLVPHLREAGVVPQVNLLFSSEDGAFVNVTLFEVLEWAYRHYVVRHIPAWVGRERELVALSA